MKYETLAVACQSRAEAKQLLCDMIDNSPHFSGTLFFVRETGGHLAVACTGASFSSDTNAERITTLLNQEHDNGAG